MMAARLRPNGPKGERDDKESRKLRQKNELGLKKGFWGGHANWRHYFRGAENVNVPWNRPFERVDPYADMDAG